MQNSFAVLVSDVEGKWSLGLVALNVLFIIYKVFVATNSVSS